MKICIDCKENYNWPNCKNCFKEPNKKEKEFKYIKYNEKLVEHGIKVAKKDKQLMKILKRLSLN